MATHVTIFHLKEISFKKPIDLTALHHLAPKELILIKISKLYHLYLALQVKMKPFPCCLKKSTQVF